MVCLLRDMCEWFASLQHRAGLKTYLHWLKRAIEADVDSIEASDGFQNHLQSVLMGYGILCLPQDDKTGDSYDHGLAEFLDRRCLHLWSFLGACDRLRSG